MIKIISFNFHLILISINLFQRNNKRVHLPKNFTPVTILDNKGKYFALICKLNKGLLIDVKGMLTFRILRYIKSTYGLAINQNYLGGTSGMCGTFSSHPPYAVTDMVGPKRCIFGYQHRLFKASWVKTEGGRCWKQNFERLDRVLKLFREGCPRYHDNRVKSND